MHNAQEKPRRVLLGCVIVAARCDNEGSVDPSAMAGEVGLVCFEEMLEFLVAFIDASKPTIFKAILVHISERYNNN